MNAVPRDMQPGFQAKEVKDMRPRRMLSAEFIFGETPTVDFVLEFEAPVIVCEMKQVGACAAPRRSTELSLQEFFKLFNGVISFHDAGDGLEV